MTRKLILPFLAASLVTLGGCEADQEALEEGVELDAPAEIENAPLVDTVGAESLDDDVGVGDTTPMQGVNPEMVPPDSM